MDRIDAMRAFTAAVDRGSLAAAARKLGFSAAKVTRGIAMLEGRLGVRLLHRSTRALHLTDFGEGYLATCRQVLLALDNVERGAAAEQEQPSGLLTVTAPLRFGQLHVRPILDAFLDANPAVQARLLLLDRMANLVEEGIDVAVRLGHLPDSRLVAARLGEVRRVLCASPGYIKRCGMPQAPAKLREHACIMERDGADTELWRFGSKTGRSLLSISVRPRLCVNSAEAAVESAVAGHGIARVMSYQAAAAVGAGKLLILLPKYEPPTIPVSLVAASARSKSPKQRAFFEFAVPKLRDRLARAASEIGSSKAGAR
jgi:DNA-binding transcriptional LysR family regulator